MAAFDRIESGFPKLDEILDYIRLGDNVVWQVSDVEEFRLFAQPFARQAVRDKRRVIYVRFAQHAPVLEEMEGVEVCRFDPDQQFESFTMAIHNLITREGKEAFYVFDCLSELQSVWYTDLMMGNFFQVTCPYLFELDTVAYFPLIRGRHSFDAVARIRDTTQLLLDVYSEKERIYFQPLKVWNRYSEHMFLPHCYIKEQNTFTLLENGVDISRYYRAMQKASAGSQDQNYDSHDRFFQLAKMKYSQGQFDPETQEQIIESTVTKDSRLKNLVKKYFKPEDYFHLRDRMIGSGSIGGKACGMLLARKIAETEIPEFLDYSESHDSFYIGSDVFYTYIVFNDCWRLRIRQRTEEEYFTAATRLKEKLANGKFPPKIREQFINLVEYFGQSPFIVRSSSFLEDGYGNAFAGKYESVFCVNQGSPRERLEAFEEAVRTVYASTMNRDALEYRRQRKLENKDEQMAVLVQRVSGTYYGKYYFPCVAGVGYSHSAYKWLPDMDPAAGMLRLVIGLGTKAVDRTGTDYPRLANLDNPGATVFTTVEERHKFSQRNVDVLDCRENLAKEVRLENLLSVLPLWYKKLVLEHDWKAEDFLREKGTSREVWFVSLQKLLENRGFTGLMQKMLQTLEKCYGNPVDIEYTVNMDESGEFVVNLLQCRSLYTDARKQRIVLEEQKFQEVFLELKGASMGPSDKRKIDAVIFVDPIGYYQYPYAKKYEAAIAVGKMNEYYGKQKKNIMLLVPGRIGTSSPELGVPVTFGDIRNFSVICEVSESRAGYMPELSYGSHMFQDLVESEILYGAVWEKETTVCFRPDMLEGLPDRFMEICPELSGLQGIVQVKEVKDFWYVLDSVSNHAVCGAMQPPA